MHSPDECATTEKISGSSMTASGVTMLPGENLMTLMLECFPGPFSSGRDFVVNGKFPDLTNPEKIQCQLAPVFRN